MKGTIKWFSEQKGYGFLIGDDEIEYHISIKEIKGAVLPKNGDIVEFDESSNSRGMTAKNVILIKKEKLSPLRDNNDERVVCPNPSCGKKIIPRIITYTPTLYVRGTDKPKRSICPFCGSVVNPNLVPYKTCFIATAVYEEGESNQLQSLRKFRDTILLTNFFGFILVKFYYLYSPPIANFLKKNKKCAVFVKILLDRIVQKLPK